jgi:hypothetical protein
LSDAKSSKQQLMAADQAEARQLVALQQRLAAVLVEQEKVRRHGVALCHHPLTNKKKNLQGRGLFFFCGIVVTLPFTQAALHATPAPWLFCRRLWRRISVRQRL